MAATNACKVTFNKYKPDGYTLDSEAYDAGDRLCRIDYTNKNMIESMEYEVGCEDRCGQEPMLDEGFEEGYEGDLPEGRNADNCIEDCHNMIREYSRGSLRARPSGELVELNAPLTIHPFADEEGEYMLHEGWENKVLEKFEDIGCRPDPEVGFRHPHEFAATTAGTEPEEDPMAFALHVRGGDKGRCMLSDVLDILRTLEGQEPVAKGRYSYMFEGLDKYF